MQKTKRFFVPLVLAALFVGAVVPTVGQAEDRYDRPDRTHRPEGPGKIESNKKFGGALCGVFSSHPFFGWLTPFSWCQADEPQPSPPPPAPAPSPTPTPPPPTPSPEPPPPPPAPTPPPPAPEPDTFSISGMKWNDENGNGQMDEGEQGLESWSITADNASGTISVSTTTSGDGTYAFATLPEDTYTVCEDQQQGWAQTFPTDNNGCHEVTLDDSGASNIDFGNMQEQEPEPEPEPEPDVDHLLITEVFYDVDDTHGTETSNEWIELYNGTGASINLTGWTIEDVISADSLGTSTIPTDTFAVIVEDDTTEPFWTWPTDTVVIFVGATIGNGLGNTGDTLILRDHEGTLVDSVSWGTNVDAFDPSVPGVAEGHSIARDPLLTDTNTATDWIDLETPTPGE